MYIYLIFVFVLVLFHLVKLKPNQGIYLLMGILFLILGFRSWNLGLYDTLNYRSYFYAFQGQPFSFVFSNNYYASEILMSFYTWLLANIFNEYGGFVLVSALIYVVSVCCFIRKWSDDIYLSVVFFFSLYYFYGFYLIKQTIAMSVLLFAVSSLIEKKVWQSLLSVGVSIMIHKYSWVFVLVYQAMPILNKIKHKICIFGLIIALGIILPNGLTQLVIKYDPTNLLGKYMELQIYNGNAARLNLGMIIYVGIALIGMILRQYCDIQKCSLKEYDLFLSISIIAAIFSSYSMVIQEFYRVASFFGIFNCVFVTKIVREFKEKKYYRFMVFMMNIFLIAYAFRTAMNTNCLDYESFFSGNVSSFNFLF